MDFDFEVIYRAVFKHQVADPLSQLSTNVMDDNDFYDKPPVLSIQTQFCKEKHQLTTCYQDCDNTTFNFEPHPLRTAGADNVALLSIVDFVLA